MTNEMKQGLAIHWKYRQYKASTFANGCYYFLGRIPLLGKFVPTSMLYGDYGLKKIITYIKIGMDGLLSIGKSLLPFLISYALTLGINSISDQTLPIFVSWFLFVCMSGELMGHLFTTLTKKEIQFISNFHVSKIDYLRSKTLLGIMMNAVLSLPWLLILGVIEKNAWLYVLIGYFSIVSLSLLWASINLRLTIRRHRILIKVLTSFVAYSVVIGILAVSLYQGHVAMLQRVIISWPLALGVIVLSIPCLYTYVHFKGFDDYGKQMIDSSMGLIGRANKTERNQTRYFGEGKKLQSGMRIEKDKFDHLSGSAYLNALLFSRFKGTLRKQMLIRIVAISVGMMGLIVAMYFLPSVPANKADKVFYRLMPIMFFVMYLSSFGKKVVQTVFMNCDSSMLSYPFYRESNAIVKGFIFRVLKVFYYNGLVAGTFVFWVIVFNALNQPGLSLQALLVFILVMFSLTLLFSFHDLFVYYLLQPFTSDLDVKNPVYKIVDGLFYFISYMNLQIHTAGIWYALLISAISISYFLIGLMIIVKIAPKTFRLKN